MTTTQPILAWHFLSEDKCLAYAPHTRVIVGETLSATAQPLELCSYGMHASIRAIDALSYAPGPIVCRVEMTGDIVRGDDKLCATHRRVIAMADATNLLHEFLCWCAERALTREREAGREPAPRSWAAIAAKRAWLRGEIHDSELDAARAAAWDAARDAAMGAAMDAAMAAAMGAAMAARDAAMAVAWAEQNRELEARLHELLRLEDGQ